MAKIKRVKKIKKGSKFGIAKFLVVALVLGGGLIYGTKMVQKNQENRSKAAVYITYTADEYGDGTKKECSDIGGLCGSFAIRLGNGTHCRVGSIEGIIYSGKCDGPSRIKCCAPSDSKTPTPTTDSKKNNVADEYVGGTNRACSSIGGKCGNFKVVLSAGAVCQVGSVTGIVYSGKCDGGGTIKCCAPKNVVTTPTSISVTPTKIPTTKTKVDGVCSKNRNECYKGTFKDITDSKTIYWWECLGLYGGKNVTCRKNK